MGWRVESQGFGVKGLGCTNLGLRVYPGGSSVYHFGFRVQDLRFVVCLEGLPRGRSRESHRQGPPLDRGFEFGFWALGFEVHGIGLMVRG